MPSYGFPEEAEYFERAETCWEQAWNIYRDEEGWNAEAGHGDHKGQVCSKKLKHLGKIFKLEATLDASCAEVFDVLIPGVLDWPEWNPTIIDCKPVQKLNENTDIAYSSAASQVGGLVSSRDFVNLRHWKSKDGVMMSASCSVVHPDVPTYKQHVRADNNPASYVFAPVPGEPNKCQFTCILNTDLKGWLPQFLIDQAMSGVLMQYLEHLKIYLAKRQKTAKTEQRKNSHNATESHIPNTDCESIKQTSQDCTQRSEEEEEDDLFEDAE